MKEKIEGKDRNYCTTFEALKGLAIIFISVAAFGFIADCLFNSEEKARIARKKGYDV